MPDTKRSPQELLQSQSDLPVLLDTYWETAALAAQEDPDSFVGTTISKEVVAAFEDNLQDMDKESALDAMWSLIAALLDRKPQQQ